MFTHILPSVCLCNSSRRDVDYFCVVHESGSGLFAYAKGRPTGSKITPLSCSTSMMDKINVEEGLWIEQWNQNGGYAFYFHEWYEKICCNVSQGLVYWLHCRLS